MLSILSALAFSVQHPRKPYLRKGLAMAGEPRFDHVLGRINQEIADAKFDKANREKILCALERLDPSTPRRIAVYYAARDAILTQSDVLPFASMLKSIGPIENLDLVIISSGGDASAAEKMLDLCRKYCSKTLRVVVPLHAKSAATLLALGADEIVMGETSELGPIDAQVLIIQDNSEQQVSADHFLRARDEAVKKLSTPPEETTAGETTAAQIQLSLLSPAFLQKCTDLMNFARDFATKQLRAHMFREEYSEDPDAWKERIGRIMTHLTASSKHLIHGRMITAQDLQEDQDLRFLRVKVLESTDDYWNNLTELLLSTEMVAQTNNLSKVLFTTSFFMAASAPR